MKLRAVRHIGYDSSTGIQAWHIERGGWLPWVWHYVTSFYGDEAGAQKRLDEVARDIGRQLRPTGSRDAAR